MTAFFRPAIAQVKPALPGGEILLWTGVVVILLVLLWLVMTVAKKKLDRMQEERREIPFTLHDLRQLHAEGKLTDDEYKKAKAQVIAMSRDLDDAVEADNRRPASPAPRPRPADELGEADADDSSGPFD